MLFANLLFYEGVLPSEQLGQVEGHVSPVLSECLFHAGLKALILLLFLV